MGQRGLGVGSVVCVCICAMQAACSSNGGSGGTGGAAGTDTAGTGGGGGGPTPCDHVIVSDPDLTFGFGLALAADGSDLFVLRDVDTHRSIQALMGGKLVDVAGLADEPTIYMGGSGLIASANGFFFDATVGGKRSIYRAPRAGGTASVLIDLGDDSGSLTPPFIGDDAYLYARAPAPSSDSLARIVQAADAGGSSTMVGSGAFAGTGPYSMVTAGNLIFTASGSVEVHALTRPPPESAGPSALMAASFQLTGCSADLGSTMAVGDSGILLGCVGADLSFHAIYRVPLPADWGDSSMTSDASAASDAAASGEATELVSGTTINTTAFLVRGSNVYYANEADPALFRMSASGGAKTKIMATHGVKHVAATDTDIFVLSACGLQQAAL